MAPFFPLCGFLADLFQVTFMFMRGKTQPITYNHIVVVYCNYYEALEFQKSICASSVMKRMYGMVAYWQPDMLDGMFLTSIGFISRIHLLKGLCTKFRENYTLGETNFAT